MVMKTKKRTFITRLFRSYIAGMIKYDRLIHRTENHYLLLHEMHRLYKFGFLMFAFIIMGCAPAKNALKTDVTQKLQSETQVSKNTEVTEKGSAVDKSTLKTDSSGVKALELIEKMTQDFEARLKIYDTDKPTDPVTGRPPLASELEIKNKVTDDKKTSGSESSVVKTDKQNNIQTEWSKVINNRIDSAMKANSKTIANTEATDTSTPWAAWAISVLLLVILVLSLFVRYKPK